MNKGKLSDVQMAILTKAIEQPVSPFYDGKTTINSLMKRGLLFKDQSSFVGFYNLTDEALCILKVTREQINVNYARYFLLDTGRQIRHNVMQVYENNYGRGYRLDYEYYHRTMEEEAEAVADWMERAIDLARAEIRAGVAQ